MSTIGRSIEMQQLVKTVKKLLTEAMRFSWEPDCAFQTAIEKVENALVIADPTYERQFETYAEIAKQQLANEEHTPYEWNELLGTEILDWDGFGDLKVTDKISKKDFETRAAHATRRLVEGKTLHVDHCDRHDAEKDECGCL